ncbi:MAG: sigma-70 family RNA polymerase sigma factor [Symploca sp. SIO2G7]|nr:sigma-70 family RNA polymerase sigma factor [Symploca sp. SIO2G7]
MKLNCSSDSLDVIYGLRLTEENIKIFRRYFKSCLKQFYLLSLYEPDDVLNEVIYRLKKKAFKVLFIWFILGNVVDTWDAPLQKEGMKPKAFKVLFIWFMLRKFVDTWGAPLQKKDMKPRALVIKTGYNVVREWKRKQSKYITLEPNRLECFVESEEEISVTLDKQEDLKRVREVLKEIRREDQELMELRWFQELSWKQIADYLAQKGQKVSVTALRKRMERLLKKLKEVDFDKFIK